MLEPKPCLLGREANGNQLIDYRGRRPESHESLRRLPAGPIELGTSRDGIKVCKGNYIVAFRPQLLQPDGNHNLNMGYLFLPRLIPIGAATYSSARQARTAHLVIKWVIWATTTLRSSEIGSTMHPA